jgi:hypothetical protein
MEQVHKLSSAFGPASVEEETAVQEVGRTKTGLLLSKSFFFLSFVFESTSILERGVSHSLRTSICLTEDSPEPELVPNIV